MGLLWLLEGTAQLHCMRRFLQAWVYAHRLALEARAALQIAAPQRRRRFDIFSASGHSGFVHAGRLASQSSRNARTIHDLADNDTFKAPREQRVASLCSLGAETMAQLEGELREARLTLFGPLPTSKASKASPASPPPVETVPPPKQCPTQPPPPKEMPVPAPPKDPPTPRGPPPRDGTPHRERQAVRGSADPAPQRHDARDSEWTYPISGRPVVSLWRRDLDMFFHGVGGRHKPTNAKLSPRALRPQVRVTRPIDLRTQNCGTHWSQLLFRLGSASLLFRSVAGTKDAAQHMLAVIRKFAPSTLERYLRIAHQFLCFLEACDIAFDQVSLAAVLDYLAAARASRSQDLEIHRISATSAIKALRWFHKLTQWEQLTPAMQSPVVAAYCSQSTAKDRKEALPIPMALIAAWEQRVCDADAPLCTVLCLGAALLATHASLRFGDIQRVDFSSLSLTAAALHGICFATKTTSRGQPFAVTISGITGRDPSSCWPLHWLSALHRAASPFREQDGDPDFLWVSASPELQKLLELAPASYCTAMLVLRWAATLPWRRNSPGLTSQEASQLTLHSMKSTVLAAAAQLRLSKDIRLSQGHHRDSAALYSRNDTFDSLYAQRRLSLALSRGWRPQRSIARGGQAPVPEPPFTLPASEPLAELPPEALLQGSWSFFATRHESLQAALPLASTTAATRAPLSPPASPRSPSFEPASHSDPCSDEEARMVEIAALRRQSSTSSHASTSSLSSDVPEPDASPADRPLYACTGPWGCWHCLKPPDDSGVLRTACGLDLGIASFTSEEPPPPLCRHMACVIRRAGLRADVRPPRIACTLTLLLRSSMADASAMPAWESPLALKQLLASLQVPDALISALHASGIDTVPDFAFAYATAQELDVFCSEDHAEMWDTLGVSDPAHSPAMARLRRALHKAKHLTEAADTALPSSSNAVPSTAQPQPNAWAEHAPPRLDSANIAQLVKDFQQNYPGEHLDGDAMPSVRLLSIVHRWFVPGNAISWVPWQLRLSEKQYQAPKCTSGCLNIVQKT
ncbi:unnamed protein product [Symbiodinium microadriaticum]|nr:unnamed protein product [Symbiodinium microadriaticum]